MAFWGSLLAPTRGPAEQREKSTVGSAPASEQTQIMPLSLRKPISWQLWEESVSCVFCVQTDPGIRNQIALVRCENVCFSCLFYLRIYLPPLAIHAHIQTHTVLLFCRSLCEERPLEYVVVVSSCVHGRIFLRVSLCRIIELWSIELFESVYFMSTLENICLVHVDVDPYTPIYRFLSYLPCCMGTACMRVFAFPHRSVVVFLWRMRGKRCVLRLESTSSLHWNSSLVSYRCFFTFIQTASSRAVQGRAVPLVHNVNACMNIYVYIYTYSCMHSVSLSLYVCIISLELYVYKYVYFS